MYSRKFRSLVQNLFARKLHKQAAFFEALEDRRLRAASYDMNTWTLSINGTNNADTITVSRVALFESPLADIRVVENGVQTYRSPLRIDRINIYGAGGDDTISISSSISIPSFIDGSIGNDTITGGSGNDTIDGWDGDDSIRAGGGNDSIWGYFGNDSIYGEAGNDTMRGEGNDDLLDGGTGADIFDGGSGIDVADYSTRSDGVKVSPDNFAGSGAYTWTPPSNLPDPPAGPYSTEFDTVQTNVENVNGSSGADHITSPSWLSSPVNNGFWGNDGNDTLDGAGGNDYLDGGGNNDTVYGGEGNDTMLGSAGDDWMLGYGGNDSILGGANNDYMDGGTGNDYLEGGTGADNMSGGADLDHVDYSSRTTRVTITVDNIANDGATGEGDLVNFDIETISGGSAGDRFTAPSWSIVNNVFYGNGGNDTLDGGGGNDSLWGSSGHDSLLGNNGNDTVSGDGDNDTIDGGAGNDHVYGGSEHDSLAGGADNDTVWGNFGNDTLNGNSGNDELYGEWDHDNLYGDSGADTLNGGSGNDGLHGGQGIDHVTGGADNDRFLDRCWVSATIFWVDIFSFEDNITDRADSEARIGFRNGAQVDKDFAGQQGTYTYAAGTWADSEIKLLDSAFAVLHRTNNNARLLRQFDGDDMRFVRHGAEIARSGVPAGDTFVAGAWNEGDQIAFPNDAFAFGDNSVRGTVFHELGHNFDEEFNASGWKAISGWTTTNMDGNPNFTRGLDEDTGWWHLTSALPGFDSTYARTNPNEDFSEAFMTFMMKRGGFSATNVASAAKNTFIQNMVNTLV